MYRHYEKSNHLPHRIISQLQQEKCTQHSSQYTRCYYCLLVQQMGRTRLHTSSNLCCVRFFVHLQWMKMLVCDVSLIGITISINSSVQVMRMNMESVKLQLELGPKAIT